MDLPHSNAAVASRGPFKGNARGPRGRRSQSLAALRLKSTPSGPMYAQREAIIKEMNFKNAPQGSSLKNVLKKYLIIDKSCAFLPTTLTASARGLPASCCRGWAPDQRSGWGAGHGVQAAVQTGHGGSPDATLSDPAHVWQKGIRVCLPAPAQDATSRRKSTRPETSLRPRGPL